MPGHRVHDRVGLITALPLTIVVTALTTPNNDFTTRVYVATLFVITYLFSIYYLSPDLDIDSIMNRRWGWFNILWFPYRKFIKHRSIISHSGPLSALIKLIYIGALPLALVATFGHFYEAAYYLSQTWYWCVIIYLAVSLADITHTLLDMYWKEK